jgi:flavin reductase (DIM6/NTAB) family NADH-FMN oxidoreductase RutF
MMECVDVGICHRLLAPRLVALLGTRTQDGTVNLIPVTNLTSVSIKPPKVVVAIYNEWRSRDALLLAEGFTLSVASVEQIDLVWKLGGRYSGYSEVSPLPKSVEFGFLMDEDFSRHGPVLKSAIAWLEFVITQIVTTAGDHTIFVGEAVRAAGQSSTYTREAKILAQPPKTLMQWSENRFSSPGETFAMRYYEKENRGG